MALSSRPRHSGFVGIQYLVFAEVPQVSLVYLSQIQVCVHIHQSVAKKCIEYLAELARHNYVTPKSYLELLNIFSILIGQKKMELKTAKNRMKSGLDKVGLRKALYR